MSNPAPAAASSPSRRHRLGPVHVLLIDPDPRISGMIRQVLLSLGFGHIIQARDGHEALSILNQGHVDFVITDWDMAPMNGIEFIRYMRRNRDSPNKKIPILMLTGKAKRHHVETARDSGITEFLVRPFTVRTLCDRLILMIDHPRNFIVSDEFTGPDRRRTPEPGEIEEERRNERPEDNVVMARHDNVTVIRKAAQDIAMIEADFSLKDKIGIDVDLNDVFSAESVAKAQQIIHNSRGEYLTWVVEDMILLNAVLETIEGNPGHSGEEVERVARAALHIKSQAGIFNYFLATDVADSLGDLCSERPYMSRKELVAARKHVDALYIIFHRNLQGTGGLIGKELKASLTKLNRVSH